MLLKIFDHHHLSQLNPIFSMKKKKKMKTPISEYTIFFILLQSFFPTSSTLLPPLPILPLPTSPQLQWQQSETALFLHFGPNTFTDSEWGTGQADPSTFHPTHFNPTQWVEIAKENGFSRLILTAKHHDGFCLWPSDYTDYSVRSSSWRGGDGDVVGELAKACEEGGVSLGIYLSPWDRHERSYGKEVEYNEFYMAQMRELLTR